MQLCDANLEILLISKAQGSIMSKNTVFSKVFLSAVLQSTFTEFKIAKIAQYPVFIGSR